MANPYRHNDSILNTTPYHDDFKPEKNYMKVLFRPSMAVQARELTQSQTYLNNQLAALGGYFFKDGTPIDGAKISYSTNQPIMRIDVPQSRDPEDYIQRFILQGVFKGEYTKDTDSILVTDYYIRTHEGVKEYYLMFSYMGSILKEGDTFKTVAADGTEVTFKMIGSPMNALIASCSEGTIFVDGYFIYVPKTTRNLIVCIIPNKPEETALPTSLEVTNYNTYANTEYHIGFDIYRKVISSSEDDTLNDNALGSYNYKAPGANRYQITATLAAYEKSKVPAVNTNGVFDFIPGIIIKNGVLIKEQPLENDGNLRDLLARRTYEESGSYTVNPWKIQVKDHSEDNSKYVVSVEPGMGYIYGYRVSSLVSQDLEVDKPRTHLERNGNVDYIADGVYTYAKYSDVDNTNYNFHAVQAHEFPDFLKMEDVYVMPVTGEHGYAEVTPLGTCKITDLYKQGSYFIVYLTDVNDIVGAFGSAKSLVSKRDVDGGVDTPKFVNIRLNEDNCAELYGTDAPKIIPTGYSMVTPTINKDNYFDGSLEYSFIQTHRVTAKNTKTLSFTLNNNLMEIDNTNGIIYIYDATNGKHIDVTNLRTIPTPSATNLVTISHQETDANVFVEGREYVVCGRYTTKNGSVRTKTVVETTETVLLNENTDVITLQNEDIIDVVSIKSSKQDSPNYKDVSISLDNGQTDYLYDYGKISGMKNVYTAAGYTTGTQTFSITYRYYSHSQSNGPFVASSYVSTTNATALGVEDLYTKIPVYRSKTTGKIYKLRDCLDFRIKKSELGIINHFPNARTKLGYDLGVYLPRIDAVWVDKNGNFGITKGIPSQAPEPPEEKDGVMTIYYLYNEAYGENINIKYINNQRHTMSDITSIENRLTNVENVLSLSLLEQSAVNMQITDEEGLNRYKSGIFTDAFNSYDNSDFTHEDWNASIDAVECSIRPLYDCQEIPFDVKLEDNTTVQTLDNVILTLKPDAPDANGEYPIFAQNTALSEQTNIQSLMFYVWTGALKLTPSIDTWVTDLGNILVSETWVETPKPPTAYRTWSVSTTTDIKTSTKTSTSTRRRNANDGWGSYWTDTYKTTATTKTATIQTKTTTETTSYNGSWTTSNVYTQMESQDTYMRVRDIKYSLKGMRPGMIVEALMDSVPLELTNNIVNKDGTLEGTFTIPEKMTVGTKLVEFFDAENTSAASAEYSANGKTVWTNVDRTYIRTWTALVSTNTVTSYAQKNLGTTTTTTKVSSVYRNLDPIAESFYIDSPNGIMLESIDLYFARKDEKVNVEIIVVECENGYPSQTMVPFSRVSKSPSEVNVTPYEDLENKRVSYPAKTNFKFDNPLYLHPETEYAFIVIAPSYNYEIYTSTLGKADLVTGIGIKEQPYIGSMFKSQNLRTWTAEQLSDITFRIHKYAFKTNSTGSVTFDIRTPAKEFEVAEETLALNTFVPNQTNIEYWYKWIGKDPVQFNNKEDIFNKSIMTIKNETDGKASLSITCNLSTTDENISPIIDLEQVYGIFTNNKVTDTSDKPVIKNVLDEKKYLYYCGTYISNPVTLENDGEDLRVILDAILPSDSGIKVYFKTTSYNPLFVSRGSYGYCISENDILSNIGKTLQVYYYKTYTVRENNTNVSKVGFVSPYTDVNIEPPKCIISGYSDGKVYVRSISDQEVFKNITDDAQPETGVYLLPVLNETHIDCPEWTSATAATGAYKEGSYVIYDGFIWRANRNPDRNTPSEYSIVWDKIKSIKVVSKVQTDNNVVWRPMTSEVIDINTTKNSSSLATEENFKEYTFYPELEIESDFSDFVIRIDLYSMNKVDVPRVKNLRAIALV